MSGPFKMKGSPMQRNFGIGSPAKAKLDDLLKGVFSRVNKASKRVSSKTQEIGDAVSKTVSDVTSKVNTVSSKINEGTQKFGSDVENTVKKVASTVNPGSKRGLSKGTKTKRKSGESQYQANIRMRRENKQK